MLTTVLERGKGLWENAWSGADKCEDINDVWNMDVNVILKITT